MIADLVNLATQHKAAVMVACAWIVRETPAVWRALKAVYPFCSANGGVFGILRNFFKGKPVAAALFLSFLPLIGCSQESNFGIPNLAQVEPGVWRGGQPTASGWEYLRRIGVHQVIKLNVGDASAEMRSSQMPVIYAPISFVDQTIGEPDSRSLRTAVEAIGPATFIHCQHGQDRTGLIVGLYRVKRERWPANKAYEEMSAHGFHPMLRGLYWAWEDSQKP